MGLTMPLSSKEWKHFYKCFFSTFFFNSLFYNNDGDFMRKYYLFIIKKDLCSIYRRNAKDLYLTLDNIYRLNFDSYSYGISIFNQLCQVFDTKVIVNYFNNKNKHYIKKYGNKFFVNDIYAREKTCVQVNHSCIVLKSNCNFPYVMNIFKWYNNNIFVCDFENNDYFWLTETFNNLKKNEYSLS